MSADDLAPGECTIEHAARLLFAALERRGRAEATRKQAVEKLAHFRERWKGKPLREIRFAVLLTYIRERLDLDRVGRPTVSAELGYLRQAWKLARAQGWIKRGWDEIMPERFDRGYVPRTRWLTPDELDQVLEQLEPARAAVVAWIAGTGCDVGDLQRARREDLDWQRGLVRVRGTKNTFRDRQVAITPLTARLLRFAEKHGPPFAPWKWINGDLRRLAKRLGLVHFTPRDLRRTHGQWLRHAGVAPHLIGRQLGHASSQMADRVYAPGEAGLLANLVRDQLKAVRERGGLH